MLPRREGQVECQDLARGVLRPSTMTNTSVQLESDVVLRDGSTVYLRPLGIRDAEAVTAFHRGLSVESRYARFFGMTDLAQASANLFAPTESKSGFFLGADLAGRLVAVAGYVRDADAQNRAEVAFAIADALQGHGLGTRMLERLGEIAQAEGIRVFNATVLTRNARMLHVFLDSGFDIQQQGLGDVVDVTIALESTSDYERRAMARAHEAASASMRGFFQPASVAVIGASRHKEKIGSIILDNIRRSGFTGRIVPINPRADSIDGLQTYPTIRAVPAQVDLAVIAVPVEHVETVVDECLEHGVKSLVVITAGFGEGGPEGQAREARLLRKIRSAGARLIGPNCLGVMNTDPRVRLNATFAPMQPSAGNVALSTQSGALGLALLDHANRLNLGLSTFVSVGNKADVSGNDLLQYWAEDPRTQVILLYLESFGDPRQFTRIARQVARRKPIVVVKAGRSHAGARAAASHTGALAASDAVVDGLFRQAGIIRTSTLEQFFDVATLLAHSPVPPGARVAVLTNAGGPGILAADACEAGQLQLPALSSLTQESLRAFLPPTASVTNPVDMIASAAPAQFQQAMTAMLADPGVDSLMVIYTPVLGSQPLEVARVIGSVGSAAQKPVVVVWLSAGEIPDALRCLPVYRFPEAAAEAVASVVRYGQWRHVPPSGTVPHADVRADDARAIVEGAFVRGNGWLTPSEAQGLLDAVGIPVAAARSVSTEEEAVRAASDVGYPVVLKAIGPTIVHKTEQGGVALGLTSEQAVRAAYRDFEARLADALTGVLVQPQVAPGVELLMGIVVDPVFGSLIACGSGGVLVELLKDTVFRLHPLSHADADSMLADLKGAALLRGFRGAPPSDIAAVTNALLRLSALIDLCPEIQELDVNPVIVHADGLRAVDVRVRIARDTVVRHARRVCY